MDADRNGSCRGVGGRAGVLCARPASGKDRSDRGAKASVRNCGPSRVSGERFFRHYRGLCSTYPTTPRPAGGG